MNEQVFKSYKSADNYATNLRVNGYSVRCSVEWWENRPNKLRCKQEMRVKNSRRTWEKKENATTNYGEEL